MSHINIVIVNRFVVIPSIDIHFNGIFDSSTFLISDHDIKKLITNVNGIILGVPLPFIGVDGTSACNNLYLEDGTTKTHCPLKAGEKYVYKNSFDVLPIYPTIAALDVYWALIEGNNKELVCFEVPAKITN